MLGQPISMLIPEVIGFRLTGKIREGVTATDLVLTVTQMLRKKGVVGKFVEFYGPGLDEMALEDRATIANMAPEYGATCGFFPIDSETLHYLKATGAQAGPRRAGREICEGTRPVPHREKRRTRLHRHARARSRDGRAEPRRSAPAAGSRVARQCVAGIRDRIDGRVQEGRRRQPPRESRRHRIHDRPWRCGDRGDHLLHQHVQSQRDDRRRPRGAKGCRARAQGAAVGEDVARTGKPGRHRLSREGGSRHTHWTSWVSGSSVMAAPPASAIPVRCRKTSRKRSRTAISWRRRCCRATAISKAACTRRCARIISHRPCSSSLMRWRVRSTST